VHTPGLNMSTVRPEHRYRSAGPDDTLRWAERWAMETLKPGDVVALYGGLGAGKTCFVQGLAKALGVDEPVISPTYTLVHEYAGCMPVYHMDLYRIKHPDEALDMGLDDYMEGCGVTVIEWAEHIESLLPPRAYRIRLEYGRNEHERSITFCPRITS